MLLADVNGLAIDHRYIEESYSAARGGDVSMCPNGPPWNRRRPPFCRLAPPSTLKRMITRQGNRDVPPNRPFLHYLTSPSIILTRLPVTCNYPSLHLPSISQSTTLPHHGRVYSLVPLLLTLTTPPSVPTGTPQPFLK